MGASDVVPGVSGGTMAFILGIYQELLGSIKDVANADLIKAIFSFNFKKVFEIVNWQFLLAVVSGIGIAVVSLAGILEYLLENQPVFLWSFFFGLVVASIIMVQKQVGSWNVGTIAALVIGTVGAYILVGRVPAQTPDTWWFLMLSGMVAICAMILPGISGSFILVLMGKYQTVLAAVSDFDITTLAFIAIGAVIGLVTFAQVLSWLFKNFNDLTVATLIGLMIGSLRKIWPWKDDLDWVRDAAGEILIRDGHPIVTKQANYLPNMIDNGGQEIFFAIGLALVGFVIILILDRLSSE